MADLTSLPGRLDVTVWHGRTETILLTWPDGALAGRGPWTATVTANSHDPIVLPVTVDEDVQTITVPEGATTPLLHILAQLVLTDDGRPVIAGTFRTADNPGASQTEATVVIDEHEVVVTIAGEAAAQAVAADLDVHEADQAIGGGVHGVVVHDFARDGWSGFTPEVMSVDGDQVFDAAVVDGRGRITGTESGDGNHRVAYLRDGTDWADSEVRSVIWGPSDDWSGTNAQQGHLHRIREISSGVWEGIAVWTAVFGGDYSLLNTRAVRFDGVDLLQSGGDDATIGAALSTIDRRVGVVAVLIGAFGTHWYRFTTPERLAHINNTGDTITVSGMSDDQFNHEDIAVDDVNNIPAGVIRVVGGSGTQGDWSFDGVGASPLITPTSRQRRWVPYTLATRVIGGDSSAATVEWMRWRPEDGPPDWGDPRVQRRDIATNANVPELPVGPGLCGLWGAHFHTGSYGEFGQVEFRQL